MAELFVEKLYYDFDDPLTIITKLNSQLKSLNKWFFICKYNKYTDEFENAEKKIKFLKNLIEEKKKEFDVKLPSNFNDNSELFIEIISNFNILLSDYTSYILDCITEAFSSESISKKNYINMLNKVIIILKELSKYSILINDLFKNNTFYTKNIHLIKEIISKININTLSFDFSNFNIAFDDSDESNESNDFSMSEVIVNKMFNDLHLFVKMHISSSDSMLYDVNENSSNNKAISLYTDLSYCLNENISECQKMLADISD